MSTSALIGSTTGTAYNYQCPSGAYVKLLDGYGTNSGLSNMGITCSNGTRFNAPTATGTKWTVNPDTGLS